MLPTWQQVEIYYVIIHFNDVFCCCISLFSGLCFNIEDCVSLLVFLVFFATIVKYQVALEDGTVVAETPEGGVEFYVNDGNTDYTVKLHSYFISPNGEYDFIFHPSLCDQLFYLLKVIFFLDCQK